jgi:macrolide-specific efflux system membrane fusion protein
MKEKSTNLLKAIFKRKKLITVMAVIIIGVLIWRWQIANGDDLDTFEIKKGTVQEELILTGSVKADEHTNLSFSTSGKIIWVGVSEGDWVKKGQALAKIDTTSLNAAYQRARSDLRSADASVEKAHDDVKDHDGDETYAQKETRTTAEVAKDKAWEAVKIAEQNLNNATLLAPFEGLVTYVANPFSGVNVLYTATQFELLNPETIYFDVSADQSEVIDIHKDQKVTHIPKQISREKFFSSA